MKVLSYGSLNYDNVYEMDHFIEPKETSSALSYSRGFGGKGLNQSIALAKAGTKVYHAGKVGFDGDAFIQYLQKYNVNTDYLLKDDSIPTGHAIIQVCHGENCIIINGGANQAIQNEEIDKTLENFGKGDILLIQNEISSLSYLVEKAHEKGLKIAFNTAPMDEKIFTYPLDLVDIFIVNEVEAKGLAKCSSTNYEEIIYALKEKYPSQSIVFTCGSDGAYYLEKDITIHEPARMVKAVDTTAAGDTFTGFFLASLLQGKNPQDCLKIATIASSKTVQHEGAAQSIPTIAEVLQELGE